MSTVTDTTPRKSGHRIKVTKWTPRLYIRVYRWARERGYDNPRISRLLGHGRQYIDHRQEYDADLKYLLKAARFTDRKLARAERWKIYNTLTPELKKYWQVLSKCDIGNSRRERVLAILSGRNDCRKYLYLYALSVSNFNPAYAGRIIGTSTYEVRRWAKRDARFGELIEAIKEAKKDFAEGALLDKIEEGDVATILHTNRTLNRDRGYGEEQKIYIENQTTHRHEIHVDITTLGLPLEVQKLILQKLKERQLENTDSQILDSQEASLPVTAHSGNGDSRNAIARLRD